VNVGKTNFVVSTTNLQIKKILYFYIRRVKIRRAAMPYDPEYEVYLGKRKRAKEG